MTRHGLNRRHFFFGSLLAGAVPFGGYGSVKSLRAVGYKPYYDKLNVAAIGCCGQAGIILNQLAQTEHRRPLRCRREACSAGFSALRQPSEVRTVRP